jgi:hypothetical protein
MEEEKKKEEALVMYDSIINRRYAGATVSPL